jgi:alkylation response protein AidB-like acyl-CoA dehydrogenase
MMETEVSHRVILGGEFLIRESQPEDIFIPEEATEEQRMIAQMCTDFLNNELLPLAERIDNKEPGLVPALILKAGEMGLLGSSIPEEYGGFGKDFITNTFITEAVGSGGSFSVSMAAHTGIGTLPILYFGTEEQKKKYLPDLATGKLKAAYCLTEPGSGSDALGAKTSAVLSKDEKHWIINGQKMWITNGGFADLFIVFAKVNGKDFTAFIIDANSAGVSRGEEEKKMGIKGSSTCQIFFQEVKIPKENLLGEVGKGHLIAFNILNIGRLKLATAALGGSKRMIDLAVQYANQREQFGKPISSFGAIQYKLAEQSIKTFVLESAIYRASNDIENLKTQLLQEGKPYHIALMKAAEEYAIECALMKVFASEFVDYVIDETIQIYGGLGYSEEYPPAHAYRDARINRIFEGTNEINRLLSIDMLLKRAMKGRIDLMTPAAAVQKELTSIPDFSNGEEEEYAAEKKAIRNMKKVLLMTAGAAVQKLMTALDSEQEVIMNAADMLAEIYLCESALLRIGKMKQMSLDVSLRELMLKTYLHDAMQRVEFAARNAVEAFAEGDMLNMLLAGIKRFTKMQPFNCKDARRQVAARLIEANQYCF